MPARTQSISELRRQLRAKRKQVAKLRARRAGLSRRLAAVDKKIGNLVGKGRVVKRRKKKRTKKLGRRKKKAAAKRSKKVVRKRKRATGKPLVQYMLGVLGKVPKGMRVKVLAAAVQKAGYKSHSKDFYAIVAKTLLQDKRFRRVTRGVYKLA